MSSSTKRDLKVNEVTLNLRTADQTRRAEIDFERDKRASDLMQAAIDNWSLPSDSEYSLVNVTTGTVIPADAVLNDSWVKQGDTLEVQPVLVAG
jgi:hypothetical protein